MAQQYKIDDTTKFPPISRKQQKKLQLELSKLNAKEMGILYGILDEYSKLKSYGGNSSSIFFSNLEYTIQLSKEHHHEITKRGKNKN